MMDKLLPHVKACVEAELAEARKINGDYFHSAHEGYGVILEEADEAGEEIVMVAEHLEGILTAIRFHSEGVIMHNLQGLEHRATLAACEYIQVAAMARKMKESIEREVGV